MEDLYDNYDVEEYEKARKMVRCLWQSPNCQNTARHPNLMLMLILILGLFDSIPNGLATATAGESPSTST